jgi:hypothetical protein
MSTDETRPDRGPAGDAFLALVHAFGPVLQIARGVIVEREFWLGRSIDPADHVEKGKRLEPLLEAYRLATAAYERLEAHGPEVADGAARLAMAAELVACRCGCKVAEEANALEAALRKLTEQPKAAPREKS